MNHENIREASDDGLSSGPQLPGLRGERAEHIVNPVCVRRVPRLDHDDLTGIYGVSFWLVVLNVLLFEALHARRQGARWRKYVIVWLFVFGSLNLYNAWRWFNGIGQPSGQLAVAVVQPNIPQRIKWDDRYSRQVLKKIFALNATAMQSSADLVVWPETAIPYYVDENRLSISQRWENCRRGKRF